MKRLDEIRRELEQIREREAIKLWRLSRRAAAHGCSEALCTRIRLEGWVVQKCHPEELLSPFTSFEFAFKFGGDS